MAKKKTHRSRGKKSKRAVTAGKRVLSGQPEMQPQHLLQQAFMHHSRGNYAEAARLLQLLTNISSSDPLFLNQVGVLAHMLGKTALGLDFLRKSVELGPSSQLYSNLGLVQEQSGDTDGAARSYDRALELEPDFAPALYNRGNLLQKNGELAAAIDAYRKAIECKPDYYQAYFNLGHVYMRIGSLYNAEICLRTCLEINSDSIEVLTALVKVLQDSGKYHDAVSVAEQLLRHDPDNQEAHRYLSLAQNMLGRADEAVETCSRALRHGADRQIFYLLLAQIHEAAGNREEAEVYLRKVLDHAPENGFVHWKLSLLDPSDKSVQDRNEIESFYRKASDSRNKMFLCFALGQAHENAGEYARSFDYFLEGNRLLRSTYFYDHENEAAFFAKIRSIFSPDFFHRNADAGYREATPIFIVGMPRSGTTLVEQIIASHPEVHGGGELSDLQIVLDEMMRAAAMQAFPDDISGLDEGLFRKMGKKYEERMRRYATDVRLVTNKMPRNFIWIGLIRAMLPNARIVHCRRDPMDTCWSNFKYLFNSPNLYAQDLVELGRYYRLYRDLMAYWHGLLPDAMLTVEYERLVENQQEETAKLLEYCGLPWDDACLRFYESRRGVQTASMTQVRQPIYRSSVQKWKSFSRELAPLAEILKG